MSKTTAKHLKLLNTYVSRGYEFPQACEAVHVMCCLSDSAYRRMIAAYDAQPLPVADVARYEREAAQAAALLVNGAQS